MLHTDSFVEIVRLNKVRWPTQNGFDLKQWEGTFYHIENRSKADERLHRAGISFFKKMETIREILKQHDLAGCTSDKTIRLFVGYLNRSYKRVISLMHQHYQSVAKNGTILMEKEIEFKFPVNPWGLSLSPDQILSGLVDGARFPLAAILQKPSDVGEFLRLQDPQILERALFMLGLGQFYDGLETLWLECLWNDWYVLETDDIDVVLPAIEDITASRAVSEFRRQALELVLTHQIFSLWKRGLAEMRKRELSARPRIKISGSGKSRRLNLELADYDPKEPPTMLIFRSLAQEIYFKDMLHMPLPRLPGATINMLLDVWELIYSLSESWTQRFPPLKEPKTVTEALKYAPTISQSELVNLINSALKGISVRDAGAIVEFLKFKPTARNELWSSPLIATSPNTLAIVFPVILTGHLLRIIELWMKRGGLELSEKGHAFEEYCRNTLAENIKLSDILMHSGVYPERLILSKGKHAEEMDIVIWIGNTVLFGEAKCIVYPTEPLEYHNYFSTLRQASEQIRRKSLFAERQKDTIRKSLGLHHEEGNGSLRIVPFILTNQPLGAGFIINGTPVTDLLLLGAYLERGYTEHAVLFDHENATSQVGHKSVFYETEEEASIRVDDYLKNPPLVQKYKHYLKPQLYPFANLNGIEKHTVLMRWEVKLPPLDDWISERYIDAF